jgi:hypothetical protein
MTKDKHGDMQTATLMHIPKNWYYHYFLAELLRHMTIWAQIAFLGTV